MIKPKSVCASVLLVLTFSAVSSAATVSVSESLDALLSGGTLNVGSITVDGFSAIETSSGTNIQPIDPTLVNVLAEFDMDTSKLSLDFQSFVAFANEGDFYDYFLNFDIDAPGGIMSAALLQVGGGAGPAATNITETIAWGSPVDSANLTTDDASPSAFAILNGNPTSINVSKDILVKSFSGDQGGFSAQVSSFSQEFMVVPEPSCVALLLIGCFATCLRRNR